MNGILSKEYLAVVYLAVIMAVRMLGLFMILPVFALHSSDYLYANAQLMGIALGVYGLTQGILQIPFGLLSDYTGRRLMITLGLALFIFGSIYAALAHTIYDLIIGRALQGGGAIGSTLLATVADLTRDENRSKAMAIMGLSIGGAFAVAMVLGPLLDAAWGLTGIFGVTAGLAFLGGIVLWCGVPASPRLVSVSAKMSTREGLINILKNLQLMKLAIGIFLLHAILTALFIIIPFILAQNLHLGRTAQILFYLIVLGAAFLLMLPIMIIAEKKRQIKPIFLSAILILGLTQLFLWPWHNRMMLVCTNLLLFFTVFSLLEALLPSWVSKIIPTHNKGMAMGIFSTAQFLGIFIGGVFGGWTFGHFGMNGIFGLNGIFVLIWLMLAIFLPHPPYLSTVIFKIHQFVERDLEILSQRLHAVMGIVEVSIMHTEDLIYVKIDQKVISKRQLRRRLENSKLLAS